MKNDLTKGIYIPSIESSWLYKENIEKGSYEVKKKYLNKLLGGKLDYSFELVANNTLINNIKIEEYKGKLYTLDVINVRYKNKYKHIKNKKIIAEKTTKELRDWTYIEGFNFNGKKFRNWKRSSGKAREGENLFIIDGIVKDCLDWSRMGLEFKGNVDIASVRAYESLPLSSIITTVEIDSRNILIIDDYDSVFKWKMSKTELVDTKLETKLTTTTEKNSIWDGQGLMDISIFNNNKLIEGKGMALLRNRYFKCCAFNTNIQQFYKEYCADHGLDYNTYKVKDIFNKDILVKDIKLITTPNSIKINKFTKQVREIKGYNCENSWLNYWLDNCGTTFGVCATEKASRYENGKYNRLSYQMFNTIPFTRREVTDISAREINYIEQLKNNLDFFIAESNIDTEDSHNIENYNDYNGYIEKGKKLDVTGAFTELVKTNRDFSQTQVFKDYRRNFIASKIKELRQGKIRVEGDYATICGNPIEMLYATTGEFTGDSITLTGNNIYCTKFDDTEDIVGFRNPHVCSGNIANLVNIKNDTISKYINATDNIVVINSIEYPIQTILQGQDFDSDTMLLTNNNIVVDACKRVDWDKTPIPVNSIANSGANNLGLTGSNMSDIDHVISQNFIGQDINLSQELNSLLNHKKNNGNLTEQEEKEIYTRISKCSSISCVEIDKAKKQFADLNVTMELSLMKKDMETVGDGDDRRIKPAFFKYIGDNKAQKQRRLTNKANRRMLDLETKKEFVKQKDIKDINVDNIEKIEDSLDEEQKKELTKLINKNYKKQKIWEEQEFRAMDTPMDWLQEEINNIKSADTIKTIQAISLVKKNKKKADDRIVKEVTRIIRDADRKINVYRSNNTLKHTYREMKINEEKSIAIKKIRKIKLNKKNMYGVMRSCFNSVKKNGKLKRRSGIENIALELLFNVYGSGLLSMFTRNK